jgi:hypothetical protein
MNSISLATGPNMTEPHIRVNQNYYVIVASTIGRAVGWHVSACGCACLAQSVISHGKQHRSKAWTRPKNVATSATSLKPVEPRLTRLSVVQQMDRICR